MKYAAFVLMLLILLSCKGQPCEKLQASFISYNEAERILQKTHFNFTDHIKTSKSSWIKSARFYSCTMEDGYFILETSKKNYIFQGLPNSIWNNFKNAESFGSYYNKFIRNRYKLILEK